MMSWPWSKQWLVTQVSVGCKKMRSMVFSWIRPQVLYTCANSWGQVKMILCIVNMVDLLHATMSLPHWSNNNDIPEENETPSNIDDLNCVISDIPATSQNKEIAPKEETLRQFSMITQQPDRCRYDYCLEWENIVNLYLRYIFIIN